MPVSSRRYPVILRMKEGALLPGMLGQLFGSYPKVPTGIVLASWATGDMLEMLRCGQSRSGCEFFAAERMDGILPFAISTLVKLNVHVTFHFLLHLILHYTVTL